MERVKPVYRPTDYPGDQHDPELAALFAYLFPNNTNPEIDAAHTGIAVTAHNPMLALNLAKMSGFIVRDMAWCQNAALHELVVQTVNLHFKCDFTRKARAARALSFGFDSAFLAVLPDWATTDVLNSEQRLVVEYTYAVVAGAVPDELFKRVVAEFDEKGAIECTAAISWWAMWAMIINALCPAP